MFCIYCGNQINDDAKFCNKCGKSTAQTQQEPELKPIETPNESPLITSATACIKKWPYIFTDISKGDDMRKWNKIFNTHLSILLGADQKYTGSSRAISEDETVRFVAPCFFDQNPIPHKQFDGTDKKIKFNSNFSEGFILVLDHDIITIHDCGNINKYEIHRNPISEMEIHEMKFKFSKLSMTSAGKGYEIMFPDHRVLFRLGLEWKGIDFKIGDQVRISKFEKENFLDLLKYERTNI